MLLLLFAFIGCAAPATPSVPAATTVAPTIAPVVAPLPPAPTAAPQPKRGGTYTAVTYTADPPDLDPYLNVSFSSQTFAGFYYSRLLKFDNGPGIAANAFIPTGDLAEKWDISKDGLTYTFSLRKNAKWQNKPPMNGRPVTADDVVWSYKRFIQVSPQKGIFSGVKDVKAMDTNTVAFTLNEVFAPFENTIAQPIFWIMPREVVEQDGDARKRVVGSGPWMFEKYDKGVQVISKRNPDYYITGQPYLDEIDSLIIPDSATSVAGLRAKTIDSLGVSQSDKISLLKTNPELKLIEYPTNLVPFFYWQLDKPPFNDARVRQAFQWALTAMNT